VSAVHYTQTRTHDGVSESPRTVGLAFCHAVTKGGSGCHLQTQVMHALHHGRVRLSFGTGARL